MELGNQNKPSSTQTQQEINSKIINLTRIRGPILPVHASKEINKSFLLTGAILSTLASDKVLKISNLKVGGSPLYYLPGQEARLENFVKFLNHKEREAYTQLKERKVLKDNDLTPDIRVAIRNIQDFASNFRLTSQPDTLYWKFFSLTEQELEKEMQQFIPKIEEKKIEAKPEIKVEQVIEKQEIKPEIKIIEEKSGDKTIEKEKTEKQETLAKKIEPIFPEKKEKIKRERAKPDKFLEEIKLYLKSKEIELNHIEKFDKKEVTGKIMLPSKKFCFFLAIDKKRIEEDDLLKAHKKSQILGLPYVIIARGELSKKLKESIDAFKSLEKIEKLA